MEVIGGVSGVLAIVACVSKLAKKLNEVKDSYDSVALNIQLAAIQLATIRDALEAIAEWRLNAQAETQASKNLDATLAEALKGCAVLITVIDSKLGEAGYAPGIKRKIRHLWLEDVLKGYMSNLDGQVRALQLLLTSFQWWGNPWNFAVTEQIQRLQRAEAQSVFEQVRADTASLTVGNKDLEDAASVLSFDPSVSFEMDEILLKHPAYKAAYGDWRPRLPKRPSEDQPSSTMSSLVKAQVQVPDVPYESPPKRKPAGLEKEKEPRRPRRQEGTLDREPTVDANVVQSETKSKPDPNSPPQSPTATEKSEGQDLSNPLKSSLTSAVEDLNRELQSAFDGASQFDRQVSTTHNFGQLSDGEDAGQVDAVQTTENNANILINGTQSDGEDSDIDEMITLLPLASHFNISKKSGDSTKPPRQLSNSSKSQAQQIRRKAVNSIRSISPTKPCDPSTEGTPEASSQAEKSEPTGPPVVAEADDISHINTGDQDSRPLSLTKTPSLRGQSHHVSVKSPSLRGSERHLSTNSNQTHGSIAEERPQSVQSLKKAPSTDSDLYTSSIAEKPPLPATDNEDDIEPDNIESSANVQPIPNANRPHHAIEEGSRVRVQDPDKSTQSINGLTKVASVHNEPAPSPALPTTPSIHYQPRQGPNKTDIVDDDEVHNVNTETVTMESHIEGSPSQTQNPPNKSQGSKISSSDSVHTKQPELKVILTPEPDKKLPGHAIPDFTAPPSRRPPLVPPIPPPSFSTLSPTTSPTPGRRLSNESTQSRYMMAGALTMSPTERDDSVNETLSTLSSSDRSDRQTLSSQMTNPNTVASSLSHPPDSLRGQAQSDLHKLQLELTAAKSRGDTSAQKASLQRSMDIIQKTYLSVGPTKAVESGTNVSSPTKSKSNRLSLRQKKSISLLSMVGRKSRQADLHEAARSGDNDTLRSLLEEKTNVNARGDRFRTPQMEAAHRSHLHCLETLKEFGADEFAVDGQGRTALHMAVISNQPKAASWLIEAYPPAAPDLPGKKSSKIAWATDAITGSRSSKILREASDGEGSRPLHLATKLALSGMVSLLLDHGSDIDAKDNWGRTPLIDAAMLNRIPLMELLLHRGAQIAVKDVNGMTALHWAAKNNFVGAVRTLLSAGHGRSAPGDWPKGSFDNNGDLPVHTAAREGHIELVNVLKLDRQLPELQTKHGETLIHITTLANQLPLAKELIRHNINVNSWAKPHSYHLRLWAGSGTNYSSKALPLPYTITALHYACTLGYYEMTELLLENGAWVNAAPDDDEHGLSPLMMAVEAGSTNLVCLLLARGAKVNAAVPATLMTALHFACKRGDLETAQELIRYGAKTAAKTKDLRTPEELVSKIRDPKKRQALDAYFAELTKQRYAKIRAQMAENLRTRPEHAPSLTPQPSPGVQLQQGVQVQPYRYTGEFMDAENDAFPDAPPAYTPGPNAPRNLANRQGVYRPQYG
ncbi:MAG: hypothetical protein Q9219_007632 [cf. Caloplaca sp. 3 TL-2023]